MEIKKLLKGIDACACGRAHVCPIEHVVVGEGAFAFLPEITKEYEHILLVADENTYKAAGERVVFSIARRLENALVFPGDRVLIPNEKAIEAIEAMITEKTDLIVGVGSGVINDLCKIVSFKHGLRYDIVATAPSMDGYASVGSALILDGMKVTLNAAVPRSIIADTAVLASAPMDMIRAGYGDIIGKYSCLNDWRLSACVTGEYICPTVVDATMEAVKTTVSLAEGISARDPKAIGALMEALVAVGILMAYVGNSRPASGSEHHLSHYFEIVGIEKGEEYLAHGTDVCFSAVETARVREAILALPSLDGFSYAFDKEKYKQEIHRIYGSVADGVIALQEKLGWYEIDRVSVYKEKWNEIIAILKDAPTAKEMGALAMRVGLDKKVFDTLYGEEKIKDALLYAKDLKDRYSVLWLYYDLFGQK